MAQKCSETEDGGPLTDGQLRALPRPAKAYEIRDILSPGLILRVLPSGVKEWSLRYRFHGKQRRLALGHYPDVGLAKVRKTARNKRAAIDEGRDLVAEQKTAKQKPSDTVAALAEDYLREHARPNKEKESADEDERILNADVLPAWGDRSVKTITRADVKAILRPIMKRGAETMANRTLALVSRMLNYAVDEDWLDANPAARVKKTEEVARERLLNDEEIRRFWRLVTNLPTTIDKPAPGRKRATGPDDDPICPISEPLAAMYRVRFITAQREIEVLKMKWAALDLDKGWWTIPAADTKNGFLHRVFLTEEARAIIRARLPEDGSKPDGYVFAGVGGALLKDRAKKAPALLSEALGFELHGKDLRRTASTRMAEAGIPRAYISYVLNHVDGTPRSTRVYDRFERDPEKRQALETWGRVLRGILDKTPVTATVTPFVRPEAR